MCSRFPKEFNRFFIVFVEIIASGIIATKTMLTGSVAKFRALFVILNRNINIFIHAASVFICQSQHPHCVCVSLSSGKLCPFHALSIIITDPSLFKRSA